MASESDNKIEALLKAYAEKRKAEAGAPIEMHPATRRLLQAEVARQWPKGGDQPVSFVQLLLRFWPRLALAAALVMGSGVAIWVSNSKSDLKPETQVAQNAKKPTDNFFMNRESVRKDSAASSSAPVTTVAQTSLSATSDSPPNSPAPVAPDRQKRVVENKTLAQHPASPALPSQPPAGTPPAPSPTLRSETTPIAGGGFGGGASADRLARQAGRGGSGPVKESLGLATADKSPASKGSAEDLGELNSLNYSFRLASTSSMERAGALAAAKAPLTGPPATSTSLLADGAAKLALNSDADQHAVTTFEARGLNEAEVIKTLMDQRAHFSQAGEITLARRALSQSGPTLLRSFDLEQTGDHIRIYDADGSVYEGRVVTAVDAVSPSSAEEVKRERQIEDLKKSKTQQQPGESALTSQEVFQASGTNVSLNQLVVINGNLISGTESALPLVRLSEPGPLNARAPATPAAPAAPAALATPAPTLAPVTRSRSPSGQPAGSVAAPAREAGLDQQLRPVAASVVRIQARAKVGASKEVEVNAVRTPR